MLIQEEKVEIVEEDNNNNEIDQEKINQDSEPKNFSMQIIGYILAFIFILFAILAIIFGVFTYYNLKHGNQIAKGVHIYGIDVSMLTKEQAIQKVSSKFNELVSKDIELVSDNYKTYINAAEIELSFDTNAAVNYAYNVGKDGNLFSDNFTIFQTMIKGINITPTHTLNQESLTKFLENLSKDLPNAVVESSYYIEDSKLVITKGTPGYVVNISKTSKDILSNITDFSYLSKSVPLTLESVSPKAIDLDKIYKEVYKEPKDAYFTKNPYTVHPSENGVDFSISLEEAKKKLANSNGEFEIKLKTTYPKISTNMIGSEAFPNLIATYSTRYNAANTDRVTNLKIAAKKINGTVILPGQTFSYNGVVGKRTIAAGYKEAGIYLNGQEAMGLGGGICQISSTLFNAALLANLKITEIHNHQFVPAYSQTGRDATVVYGTKDFKFVNSRNFAIKITCSVSGGIAKFNIYGVKEASEPTVGISVKVNSKTATYIKSSTYRTLKQNGKVISSEKIYNCTYKVH